MRLLYILVALLAMPTRAANLDWFQSARFGLFIHFGLYAIPAGYWNNQPVKGASEWIMNDARIPVADYEKLKAQFNPRDFVAKDYVALARSAGMKYIVITAKHHDGFCLWNTQLTDYNSQTSPGNRDLIQELAQACEADKTVRFCIYYSISDWHHPDSIPLSAPAAYTSFDPAYKPNPNFPRYIDSYLKPQLKELINAYHPAVLWFDGEWIPEYTEAMGRDIDTYCRQLDPGILLNNRVGKSRKGFEGFSQDKNSPGDFATPEQQIPPSTHPGAPWESCMTMNDTWGYKKDDTHYKPTKVLIQNLVDVVSKGGNYLLNVGPTPEGKIPDQSVKSLNEIATWMAANSDSIHGATASPFTHLYFGRATAKPGHVYLHQFLWNKSAPLVIPLSNKPLSATLLADPTRKLTVTQTANTVQITGQPEAAPDPIDTVIDLQIEGSPVCTQLPITPAKDGTLTLGALDANLKAQNARVEKKGDRPFNIGYWTNINDTASWQANLPDQTTYTVNIEYSLAPSCKGAQIALQFTSQNNTQSLQVDLKEGKDFLDFKTEPAGQLTLPKGPCTITLVPTKKPGVAVIDLRQITLKPQ